MEYEYLQFSRFYNQHVHLGITGSIAAFKSLQICRELMDFGIQVSVTLTSAARNFVTPLSFEALGITPVYGEMFSPQNNAFAHLEPSETAQAFLIAPSTANNIAKLAYGLADDMLTCQALAFNGPILLAPAMNPNLWSAQPTQENIQKLTQRGNMVLGPKSGEVACGHTGEGRLTSIPEIVFNTLNAICNKDMKDQNVLITLGATREYWDPARFWSNPSSGKMGAALAIAAWLRGANVHCICGPNKAWLPGDITSYDVTSARQMFDKTLELWPNTDIACLCAAVSDFRPESVSETKFKKQEKMQENPDHLNLNFTANPDILQTLGERKTTSQKLVGFAAETDDDLFPEMKSKLHKKNLNLIVSNKINQSGTGFDSDNNEVNLLDDKSNHQQLPTLNKADIAWKIWDWTLKI